MTLTRALGAVQIGLLLHELSNRGAKTQFEVFLDEALLPAMARCAQLGARECHVVVLSSEDTVEWDDDLPPALGEQFAQGAWMRAYVCVHAGVYARV